MSMYFKYSDEVIADYPNITACAIIASGINNPPTNEKLRELLLNQQRKTLEHIGDTPLSEIESLAAWRSSFRKFGVNPTKYRSAPEALLRRLTKKGDIPSINTLVDIGNLISIRYKLPSAVFDTSQVKGGIRVHHSTGKERFTPLFEKEVKHPEEGEVIFSDENDMVVARRWCWRQSDQSAARDTTTDAIIVVEAQHEGSGQDVQSALDDWVALLGEFSGGEFETGLLGKETPALTA